MSRRSCRPRLYHPPVVALRHSMVSRRSRPHSTASSAGEGARSAAGRSTVGCSGSTGLLEVVEPPGAARREPWSAGRDHPPVLEQPCHEKRGADESECDKQNERDVIAAVDRPVTLGVAHRCCGGSTGCRLAPNAAPSSSIGTEPSLGVMPGPTSSSDPSGLMCCTHCSCTPRREPTPASVVCSPASHCSVSVLYWSAESPTAPPRF